ncbi:MAG: rod shape-determining protein MreC [Proteobacteria bacterium]|nr:rod shape-determining protein MreC [Pseudomonadota bacterium]
MIIGVIIIVSVNIIFLSVSSKYRYPAYSSGRVALNVVAPFQDVITNTMRFATNIWRHYFFLVSAARENDNLKKELSSYIQKSNEYHEIELSNIRLRNLFDFRQNITGQVVAAEVIGVDPSPWYRTIVINKGKSDGIRKGMPVVIPEGVVGQVIDAGNHSSKVLLVIDQNSAVDALVQRNRVRGIVKGISSDKCILKYVVRRHDIGAGDIIITSGFDGVFPKGLSIGYVEKISQSSSGLFHEVEITPYADFEKIEEVLVLKSFSMNNPEDKKGQ